MGKVKKLIKSLEEKDISIEIPAKKEYFIYKNKYNNKYTIEFSTVFSNGTSKTDQTIENYSKKELKRVIKDIFEEYDNIKITYYS